MCADTIIFDSTPQGNSSTEPFLVRCTTDDGEEYTTPVRVILECNGLIVHRDPVNGQAYNISHRHTGMAVPKSFERLKIAFQFLRVLDQVYDFDGLKEGSPTLSAHQKWCMRHIIGEYQRWQHEGWMVPPDHWIGMWNWRTDAAQRTDAHGGGE